MVDIPVGKALAPKEIFGVRRCNGDCCLYNTSLCGEHITCKDTERKDGKHVVFELVDYPVKESSNG